MWFGGHIVFILHSRWSRFCWQNVVLPCFFVVFLLLLLSLIAFLLQWAERQSTGLWWMGWNVYSVSLEDVRHLVAVVVGNLIVSQSQSP